MRHARCRSFSISTARSIFARSANGVLLGVYEKDATPWAVAGTPWDYGETELLPPTLDRLTDSLEKGFRRFPSALAVPVSARSSMAHLRSVPTAIRWWARCRAARIFGRPAASWLDSPKAAVLVLALAQWMIDGEPEGDIYAMDVARFGAYATRPYAHRKGQGVLREEISNRLPERNLAGGPAEQDLCHPPCSSRGKRRLWCELWAGSAPVFRTRASAPAVKCRACAGPTLSMRCGEECLAARGALGLLDISSFAKYRISGEGRRRGAGPFARRPTARGRQVRITPMLSPRGRLMGDLTTPAWRGTSSR